MASFSAGTLPTGPRGRALAVAVTLIALVVVWLGAVSPLLDLYDSAADAITQRRALAGRMQDLADALPELRRQVAASQPKDAPAASLLEGASDAVAAATLQGLLEKMCVSTGAKITSSEALPAEQAGAYRRIGLRVSLDANWTQLINLLRAAEKATPRMFVDDLQLHAQPTNDKVRELPIDIALTLLAFRLPGAPPAVAAAAPTAAALPPATAPAPEPGQTAGPGAAAESVPPDAAPPPDLAPPADAVPPADAASSTESVPPQAAPPADAGPPPDSGAPQGNGVAPDAPQRPPQP